MPIVIAGTIDFAADAAQLIRNAQPLIEAGLREPGCHAYSWAVDPARPERVLVHEEWDDEASLAAHFDGAPYRDMGAHLNAAGVVAMAVRKYRSDLAEPVYDESGAPRADFFTAGAADAGC